MTLHSNWRSYVSVLVGKVYTVWHLPFGRHEWRIATFLGDHAYNQPHLCEPPGLQTWDPATVGRVCRRTAQCNAHCQVALMVALMVVWKVA